MFSLSAFIGFLAVLLAIQQYYYFGIVVLVIFFYLALLEYNNHKANVRDLTMYLVTGLLCGSLFGYSTWQKFKPNIFQESIHNVNGVITSVGENSITVDVSDSNNHIDKIKLSRRVGVNGSFDPFLFDRIYFSCDKWRTKVMPGIYLTLEQLQGIYNVCKEGKIHSIKESSVSFNNLRRWVRNHVRQSLNLLGETSFARGFVLNDTSNINQVELNLFRKMGIAHLFSASGLHMGLLYTTCFLPFSYLGFRKTGYTLALMVCFIYLCVLDFSIPLLRSYIFLALYIVLKLLKRQSKGKYILYFSIILLELIFPLSCFSPSFILSFLITLMILLYYPQFKKIILVKSNYLKDHIALTISASLGSCFLSVFLFNYYHPVSVLYNLILVPFSGIYLASIFLYLVFPVFKYIIILGDYIFREACRLQFLMVEKYIPENHAVFTQFWLALFFLLTLYFIYYSFQHKYWYLRKYYMNTYLALSAVFLSNTLFIKIPVSSTLVFPYGVLQYKNNNYYIAGKAAGFSEGNEPEWFKYVFQKMNYPFHEIYASNNFIGALREYKVHQKYEIQPLDQNQKQMGSILFLNEECYFFLNPKKTFYISKKQRSQLSGCKTLNIVHSKKTEPDRESIKKLFSRFGLSTKLHYMKYFNLETVDKPVKPYNVENKV
jgi:ComEC/Rec2-related protein